MKVRPFSPVQKFDSPLQHIFVRPNVSPISSFYLPAEVIF